MDLLDVWAFEKALTTVYGCGYSTKNLKQVRIIDYGTKRPLPHTHKTRLASVARERYACHIQRYHNATLDCPLVPVDVPKARRGGY